MWKRSFMHQHLLLRYEECHSDQKYFPNFGKKEGDDVRSEVARSLHGYIHHPL